MTNLYQEIKNYVLRIKSILGKALDAQLLHNGSEQETKMIISYLITLGEDKAHLKNIFIKFNVL